MKKTNELLRLKTIKRYKFQSDFSICTTTSDPETTSPSPLTTTHIFKK